MRLVSWGGGQGWGCPLGPQLADAAEKGALGVRHRWAHHPALSQASCAATDVATLGLSCLICEMGRSHPCSAASAVNVNSGSLPWCRRSPSRPAPPPAPGELSELTRGIPTPGPVCLNPKACLGKESSPLCLGGWWGLLTCPQATCDLPESSAQPPTPLPPSGARGAGSVTSSAPLLGNLTSPPCPESSITLRPRPLAAQVRLGRSGRFLSHKLGPAVTLGKQVPSWDGPPSPRL